jgi:hypothetical protein
VSSTIDSNAAVARLSAQTKAGIVAMASQAWEGTTAQFRAYMRLINDVLQEAGDGLALVDDETPGMFVRGGAEWADTLVFCPREEGLVEWGNGVDVDASAFEADLKLCFDKALANLRFERVGCADVEFVTVPTHELEGDALNWAVEECEGDHAYRPRGYSTDWAFGGPIIDREGIAVRKHSASGTWYAMALADLGDVERPQWCEFTPRGADRYGKLSYEVRMRRQRFHGATALEAALRCHVATKLGESVQVPTDLQPGEREACAHVAQRPRG